MGIGSLQVAGKNPVDVQALLDSKLTTIAGEIIVLGAMVSLSTTSDGGALMVQVTLDKEYVREYFRDSDEAIDWLAMVEAEVRKEVEGMAASPGRGSRRRGRQRAPEQS